MFTFMKGRIIAFNYNLAVSKSNELFLDPVAWRLQINVGKRWVNVIQFMKTYILDKTIAMLLLWFRWYFAILHSWYIPFWWGTCASKTIALMSLKEFCQVSALNWRISQKLLWFWFQFNLRCSYSIIGVWYGSQSYKMCNVTGIISVIMISVTFLDCNCIAFEMVWSELIII